jgi:hypothetical protein
MQGGIGPLLGTFNTTSPATGSNWAINERCSFRYWYCIQYINYYNVDSYIIFSNMCVAYKKK